MELVETSEGKGRDEEEERFKGRGGRPKGKQRYHGTAKKRRIQGYRLSSWVHSAVD